MDPVSIAIGVGQFALSMFSAGSQAKYQRRVQRLVNQLYNSHLTDVTRPEFDFRYRQTREGNDRQYGLYDQGLSEEDQLIRTAFTDLNAEEQSAFDEQLSIRSGLDLDRFTRAMDTVEAYSDARTENTARYVAAKAEQDAKQAMSDALADIYMTTRGTAPFEAQRGAAEADRNAVLAATLSAESADLPTPPGRGNPVIDGAFADQQARGIDEATGDAQAQNRVLAAGDAVLAQERGLKKFVEGVDGISLDARLAAAPLSAQNFATNLRAQTRGQDNEGRYAIEEDMASRLSEALGSYRTKRSGAKGAFYDDSLATSNNFYGNMTDTEAGYTQGVVGASDQYENAMGQILNYKIGSIQGSSGAGGWDLLSAGLGAISGGLGSLTRNRKPSRPAGTLGQTTGYKGATRLLGPYDLPYGVFG